MYQMKMPPALQLIRALGLAEAWAARQEDRWHKISRAAREEIAKTKQTLDSTAAGPRRGCDHRDRPQHGQSRTPKAWRSSIGCRRSQAYEVSRESSAGQAVPARGGGPGPVPANAPSSTRRSRRNRELPATRRSRTSRVRGSTAARTANRRWWCAPPFTQGKNADRPGEAGADVVGSEDPAEKVKAGVSIPDCSHRATAPGCDACIVGASARL